MKKGELRKQSILEMAEQLFYKQGYTATTIQDLIDTLGCSKGSFYHHFESKLQVLEEISRERARQSFAEYEKNAPDEPLKRLNAMLYYAVPFRSGQEAAVAMMLPLEGTPESGVVREAQLEAQADLFYPEFQKLLAMCRAAQAAHYAQPLLPQLLWDAYTALYRRLMQCAKNLLTGAGEAAAVREALDAERFMIERLLDTPYGSVEIVRADEALTVIYHAVNHVKALDKQDEQR